MEYNNEPVLGIHIGTTNFCFGIWNRGKPEIIYNEIGNRITPCMVSFTQKDIFVGESAKNMILRNYKNTIYDIKNLIGKDFDDLELQRNLKNYQFKVIKGTNNKPKISVEYKGKTETFFPEEILSLILKEIKKLARNYFGKEINDAILTCPSFFKEKEKQKIKESGKIAGLNIIKIIDESIAAGIAYGFDKNYDNNKIFLVFYLGGKKLDISIVSYNYEFNIISSKRNNYICGESFDNKILKFCIDEFKNQTNIDISSNLKVKYRLKNHCEKAKINLSSTTQVLIDIDCLYEDEDCNLELFLDDFQNICRDIFNEIPKLIEETLKEANLRKYEIDDIILVGGSTRIPKIQNIIEDFFNKKPLKNIHPDEVIAIGAIIEGTRINTFDDSRGIEKLTLLDYTCLSIGYELSDGQMEIVIPKNSAIPYEKSIKCKTVKDNQSIIIFKLYEGERLLANKNKFLGKCEINNIPPKKRGEIIIEINFEININGNLFVTLYENCGGQTNSININLNHDFDKIEEIINEAKEMEEYDKMIIETNKIKKTLYNYCLKKKIEGTNSEKIKANEIIKWMENNPNLNKEEYEKKLMNIKYSKIFIQNDSSKFVKLSIGYELFDGEMKFIILRNSYLPIKKDFIFEIEDEKKEINLKIYEGERLLARRNNLLKECTIKLPQNLEKNNQINCSFEINSNYLLTIFSNQQKIDTIQLNKNIDQDDIDDIVKVAEKMKEKDNMIIQTYRSKFELKKYALMLKSKSEEVLEWIEKTQKKIKKNMKWNLKN